MTEEEKTLKYLSAMRVIDFNKLGFVYGKETITDILNLIQKQQEEKKIAEGEIKFSKIEIGILSKENKKLNKLKEKYIEQSDIIRAQQAEIEKKDKIIDAMTCTIYDYANLGKLKICECELEDGKIDLSLCNQTLADRNCCKCIKQYFEKQVESRDKQC